MIIDILLAKLTECGQQTLVGESLIVSNWHSARSDMEQMLSDITRTVDDVSQVTSQLGEMSFSRKSKNQVVEATVMGTGDLVNIRISQGSLKRSHLDTLGSDIMEAILQARQESSSVAHKYYASVTPGLIEDEGNDVKR